MKETKEREFTGAEAQRRFEAALRGSRQVGPKPLKDVPKTREKPQGKRAAKKS